MLSVWFLLTISWFLKSYSCFEFIESTTYINFVGVRTHRIANWLRPRLYAYPMFVVDFAWIKECNTCFSEVSSLPFNLELGRSITYTFLYIALYGNFNLLPGTFPH